jgi:hypothetical protein
VICHQRFWGARIAKDDRSGLPETRDERGVLSRDMARTQAAPGLTTQSSDVDAGLDGDGHAQQRRELPAIPSNLLSTPRLGTRALIVNAREGVNLRIEFLNPRQVCLYNFDW